MITISKDGTYGHWLSKQPEIINYQALMLLLHELSLRQPKSVLIVGLDLTAIAALSRCCDIGASATLVIPAATKLTGYLRDMAKKIYPEVIIIEDDRSGWLFPLPDAVSDKVYDFVVWYNFCAVPDHIFEKSFASIASVLSNGASVFFSNATRDKFKMLESYLRDSAVGYGILQRGSTTIVTAPFRQVGVDLASGPDRSVEVYCDYATEKEQTEVEVDDSVDTVEEASGMPGDISTHEDPRFDD